MEQPRTDETQGCYNPHQPISPSAHQPISPSAHQFGFRVGRRPDRRPHHQRTQMVPSCCSTTLAVAVVVAVVGRMASEPFGSCVLRPASCVLRRPPPPPLQSLFTILPFALRKVVFAGVISDHPRPRGGGGSRGVVRGRGGWSKSDDVCWCSRASCGLLHHRGGNIEN